MARYLVKRVYKYTVNVVVEAESERAAKDAAEQSDDDGERNHDDYLYDCEVERQLEEGEEL